MIPDLDRSLRGAPELHLESRQTRRRSLGSNDGYESLLVDSRGNAYEPYSLAWRYLGLYADCDAAYYQGDVTDYNYNNGGDYDYGVNRGRRLHGEGSRGELPGRRVLEGGWQRGEREMLHRELGGGLGGGPGGGRRGGRDLSSNDGDECQRQLLWAAYVDPRYKGVDGIEEYSFYDLETGEWDERACDASGRRHRCVRMDCHEPRTHFKLVGVFKETDGMYDFHEQLFKHEGYCVWSGDDSDNGGGSGSGDGGGGDSSTYETMEEWMENWPTGCQQLNNPDYYGNTIYLAVRPLAEGNMTLGIYADEACTTVSPHIDLYGYIIELYSMYYYYYGQDRGTAVAEYYSEGIATWNEKMSTFKVCQPCRAYNLFSNRNGNNREQRRRFLGGDENDGEGDETTRFNCYDDAGYTNVDQCYKFETHTTMEAADSEDLARASAQGSILRVKALDGKVYGEGGYTSSMARSQFVMYVVLGALAFIGVSMLIFGVLRHVERRGRRASRRLKETLTVGRDDDTISTRSTQSLEMPSVFKSLSAFGAPKSPIQEARDEKKRIDRVFKALSAVQMRMAGKEKCGPARGHPSDQESDSKWTEEEPEYATLADEKSPRASYAPPQETAAMDDSNPMAPTPGTLLGEKNSEIFDRRLVDNNQGLAGASLQNIEQDPPEKDGTTVEEESVHVAPFIESENDGVGIDAAATPPTDERADDVPVVATQTSLIGDTTASSQNVGQDSSEEVGAAAQEENIHTAMSIEIENDGVVIDAAAMPPTDECADEVPGVATEISLISDIMANSQNMDYNSPEKVDVVIEDEDVLATLSTEIEKDGAGNDEAAMPPTVEYADEVPGVATETSFIGDIMASSLSMGEDPPEKVDVSVEGDNAHTALSIESKNDEVENDAAETAPTDECADEAPSVATETNFVYDIMTYDSRQVDKGDFC